MSLTAESLARRFHEAYERLAPQFGYTTRAATRTFDPASPNGLLMTTVCEELLATLTPDGGPVAEDAWVQMDCPDNGPWEGQWKDRCPKCRIVAHPPARQGEDAGMVKRLTDLLDRGYKMLVMAGIPVSEQNPNHNNPIIAWASDVRSVLYQNKPLPDVKRDLQTVAPSRPGGETR